MKLTPITSPEWHLALASEYDAQIDLSDYLLPNARALGERGERVKLLADSYDALEEAIMVQFAYVASRLSVTFSERDPYESPEDMFREIRAGQLRVFTGGELPKNHPMSHTVRIPSITSPVRGGEWQTLNNVFRAVHDYFGHYARGKCHPFGVKAYASGGDGLIGEELAYQEHRQTLPPSAYLALTVETRCQTAANNLLPRVVREEGFIEQKAVWLPIWCYAV